MKFNLVALLAILAFVLVASVEAVYDYDVCFGTPEEDCEDCCSKNGFDGEKSMGYSYRVKYIDEIIDQCACWRDFPKRA